MAKKIIISENTLRRIAEDSMLNEASGSFNEKELVDKVKNALKSDTTLNKELDKRVKTLVANCVNNLFKTLWMRRSYYEDEIKK